MTVNAYRGALLTLDGRGRLRFWSDGALAVGEDGIIRYAGEASEADLPDARWIDRNGTVIIPGLIDAHCHLPQYPAVASDGLTLLPWLKKRIFPLERAFRGAEVRDQARRFFADLAAAGTTTACVYTAIWKDSTDVCFEEAERSGLRVVMGKVMMDRGSYDADFRGTERQRRARSLAESDELCLKWNGRAGRLHYAFTPRFALSCSMELLSAAAALAAQRGAYLQTHLAENHEELRAVAKAFPGIADYTSVYDRAGLLTRRTVLGHGIWLSKAEARRLARRGSSIAHCPLSNAFLGSGVMDAAGLEREGVNIALGSDVAAGPTLNLFESMRQAVYLQRAARAHGLFGKAKATTPLQAFRMATIGGARALGLEDRIGTLEAGKEADFLIIDRGTFEPAWANEAGAESILSRLVYRVGTGAVGEAFVKGRLVWPSGAGSDKIE